MKNNNKELYDALTLKYRRTALEVLEAETGKKSCTIEKHWIRNGNIPTEEEKNQVTKILQRVLVQQNNANNNLLINS